MKKIIYILAAILLFNSCSNENKKYKILKTTAQKENLVVYKTSPTNTILINDTVVLNICNFNKIVQININTGEQLSSINFDNYVNPTALAYSYYHVDTNLTDFKEFKQSLVKENKTEIFYAQSKTDSTIIITYYIIVPNVRISYGVNNEEDTVFQSAEKIPYYSILNFKNEKIEESHIMEFSTNQVEKNTTILGQGDLFLDDECYMSRLAEHNDKIQLIRKYKLPTFEEIPTDILIENETLDYSTMLMKSYLTKINNKLYYSTRTKIFDNKNQLLFDLKKEIPDLYQIIKFDFKDSLLFFQYITEEQLKPNHGNCVYISILDKVKNKIIFSANCSFTPFVKSNDKLIYIIKDEKKYYFQTVAL